MLKSKFIKHVLLFIILQVSAFLFSEEPGTLEDSLKILKNVLQVDFEVKLIQPGDASAWKEKITKFTIPGHSILLKVESTDIKFYGYFTPYTAKDDKLMLLAQGQVWLSDSLRKSIRYLTYFKSIHLAIGEKAIFLPLGVAKSNETERVYNIEIEIQIYPYNSENGENGN